MAKKRNSRKRNAKVDAPDAFSQETDEQIQAWTRQALERPGSFALFDHPRRDEMFVTWSLGPVVLTRDSPILDKANWKVLKEKLESDPTLEDDYNVTGASHWAVGWVDHLSFRVLDPDGSPSRMSRILKDWNDGLSDYPVADESVLSAMEDDAFHEYYPESAQDAARIAGIDTDELPEGWEDTLLEAVRETRADQSGPTYLSDGTPVTTEWAFKEAFEKLGWGAREGNPCIGFHLHSKDFKPLLDALETRPSAKAANPKKGRGKKRRRRKFVPLQQRHVRTAPYRRPHIGARPTTGVAQGAWRRPNPKSGSKSGSRRRKQYTPGDAALSAGVWSLVGGLGGFVVGGLLFGGVGAIAGGEAGGILGVGLGAIAGAVTGSYVGAYQGGKRRAPRGEEKEAAFGGLVGNFLFGPIGAAGGAWIGAKANPGRARNPTSYGPYYVASRRVDPRTRQLRLQYLRPSPGSPRMTKFFSIDDAIIRAAQETERTHGIYHWVEGEVAEPGVGTYTVAVWDPQGRAEQRYLVANGPRASAAGGALLGSVAGGLAGGLAGPVTAYAGQVVGSAIGANMGAPAGYKSRGAKGGAWGGALGGAVGAPIGAALMTGKKDPKDNPRPNPAHLRRRLTRK